MMPIRKINLGYWIRHPAVQITILGELGWLAYLHLALPYPLPALVAKYPLTDLGRANDWNPRTLVDLALTILLAFGCYLAAWRVARRHPKDPRLPRLILAFAVIFAVTLIAMYPIAATDIFEYVFHSRILVRYNENPLAVPPIQFKGDPLLKTVNWAVQPSPYGPLWVILTVPGSLVAGADLVTNLTLMKWLAGLFYFGCSLLVAAILQHKHPDHKSAGLVLFAWNPLVLFEAPGNGHNGIMMMFFALLAIYLTVRQRWLWVLPVLTLSVLIKYVTAILFLPFLIYCLRAQKGLRNRVVFLAKAGAICTIVVLVFYLPFPGVPSGLVYQATFSSLLAIPTLFYHLLRGPHGDQAARTATVISSSALYLLVYLLSVRFGARSQHQRHLVLWVTWLLVAYLAIASIHFQPWFLIWPIALGIWVDHWPTRHVLLAFSLSGLSSYGANFLWIWNIRHMPQELVNVMFVAFIFAPPLLVGLVDYLWAAVGSSGLRAFRLHSWRSS